MDTLNYEMENYLSFCRNSKGLSPHTIKAYVIDLRQFCEQTKNADVISKETICWYIDWLYQQYKPKSAKRKIACIKAFYRYMEIENRIEENPFHKIQIKHKAPMLLPKTIPLNDVEKILKYAYFQYKQSTTPYQQETALRNLIVLELMFATGMRVSEISNLKIEDINLKNRSIRTIGKGAKERILYIANPDSFHMLESYTSQYQRVGTTYIFNNRRNRRLSEQSIRNMVNTYAIEAGIQQHITPHMFRHTFATSLLEAGVDIRYIQQMLGHSSILTTQIYTYTSTAKIRSILESSHPRNSFVFK